MCVIRVIMFFPVTEETWSWYSPYLEIEIRICQDCPLNCSDPALNIYLDISAVCMVLINVSSVWISHGQILEICYVKWTILGPAYLI